WVDGAKIREEWPPDRPLPPRAVPRPGARPPPPQDGEGKARLAARLLDGQVSGTTADLVSGMVRSRWSQPRDLVDAVEELAAVADLSAAQRSGSLDNVEDELFRFGRIVLSSPDLRAALTDRSATVQAKTALLRTLLGGRAEAVTERLVVRLVAQPRGRSLEAGIHTLSRIAAERRDRLVAVVTSAVPLNDSQKQRLGAVLARLYGHPMHLNLDVDPAVLGGISVRVGDEVINGTIADRLDEAARRLAG
uniref:F0F1 ATP synthase subunit delta n=1 Tax=Streptomyces sp. SID1121 TaxID=3425888 RepID=UPI004056981E